MTGYSVMTLWIAFLFVGLAQAQTKAPVKCPPAALTATQILDLVKGGLPEGRIAQIVATCHIGFLPSVEVIERISRSGASEPVLEALIADGYSRLTLDQAKAELAILERKIADITTSSNASRDSALAKLEAEYAPRLADAGNIRPRDQFESTAAFEARRSRAEAALAELEKNRTVEK